MTRLGLFGGTFDPVHNGHLRAVDGARRELKLDRVLLLPNPQPPHKLGEELTPYLHRKEMLRLALADYPKLEIGDFEEQTEGPAYTTDTVRRIVRNFPADFYELWLILGMDSLIELPRWKDPEELFRYARVAVLPRPGFAPDAIRPDYITRVKILQTPLVDVSATEIRRRLKCGQSTGELLPPAVAAYIRDHGLYSG
jgi:nicotinate-nucleotide adenylyltransferase